MRFEGADTPKTRNSREIRQGSIAGPINVKIIVPSTRLHASMIRGAFKIKAQTWKRGNNNNNNRSDIFMRLIHQYVFSMKHLAYFPTKRTLFHYYCLGGDSLKFWRRSISSLSIPLYHKLRKASVPKTTSAIRKGLESSLRILPQKFHFSFLTSKLSTMHLKVSEAESVVDRTKIRLIMGGTI